MRIVYLTFEYMDFKTGQIFDGGFANYIHKISQTMSQRGHDVFVIKFITEEAAKGEEAIIHRKVGGVHAYQIYNGVRFTQSSHKLLLLQENWKVYLWRVLPDFIRRKLPGRFYKKNGVQSLIYDIHDQKKIDIIQAPATGNYSLVPAEIPACARIVSHPGQWITSYNMDFTATDHKAYQGVYNSIRFLFGPSKRIIESLKEDFQLQKDITCIETLYDTTPVTKDPVLYLELENKIKGNPYLLFYGALGILKGTYDIADIIYDLFDKYQNLYFVFVGKEMIFDGKKTPYQYLLDKAGQYADRIIYFPSQPKSTLYPIIEHAKGIVLPSRTDNFPNTCVESMRLKKTIVGTREGSFDQLLDDNVSGFICDGAKPQSLFNAICRLMDTPDKELAEMGQRAFERSNDLEPDKIAKQLEQYYKKVIESWR